VTEPRGCRLTRSASRACLCGELVDVASSSRSRASSRRDEAPQSVGLSPEVESKGSPFERAEPVRSSSIVAPREQSDRERDRVHFRGDALPTADTTNRYSTEGENSFGRATSPLRILGPLLFHWFSTPLHSRGAQFFTFAILAASRSLQPPSQSSEPLSLY
jgi:hypothetical protein